MEMKGRSFLTTLPAVSLDEDLVRLPQVDVVICDDYVYLGTNFNYSGLFQKAIGKQMTQTREVTLVLLQKIQTLHLLWDIQCELFDRSVAPVLLHGSEVYDFDNIENVESFHKWYLKFMLKLKSQMPAPMVYGEAGCTELGLVVKCHMIKSWASITQKKNSEVKWCVLV